MGVFTQHSVLAYLLIGASGAVLKQALVHSDSRHTAHSPDDHGGHGNHSHDGHGGHDGHAVDSHDGHGDHHDESHGEPAAAHHGDGHKVLHHDDSDSEHNTRSFDDHQKSKGKGKRHDDHAGGHGDHGDHAHGHPGHSKGAHSVAVGLVATVILVPLTVSMALSGGKVHELTMKMLDTFTSIFLAVLWFNTFRQILKTLQVGNLFPYAHEFFSLMQIIVLYCIANFVAYLWQDNNMRLTTFCSCGAHFIAFAGIIFAGESQHSAAQLSGKDYDEVSVWGMCLMMAIFLTTMFVANNYTWRRHMTGPEHKKMQHSLDELELDVMGLVISFVITQAIRHALTGKYPPLHFLQGGYTEAFEGHDAFEGHKFGHTLWQRWFMFFWSVSLMILAAVALPRLDDFAARSGAHSVQRKIVHTTKVILIMLIAWGFLLWGEWEFYEHLFQGDIMFGHMMFAVLATLLALLVLWCVAYFQPEEAPSRMASETNGIITTGISLVAAWSWEHCFNLAFDIIGHEYQVGYDGLVPKIVLSIVVPAALLPTYLQHVRKRVIEFEEEEHGHEAHAPKHAEEENEGTPATEETAAHP